MHLCPCGSTINHIDCCGAYIGGQSTPTTPEALMRSRYTAYSMANIDYIKKTMKGKALLNFNDLEATLWAKRVVWLGLKIVKLHKDASNEHQGFVEFVVNYLDGKILKTIHEISEFQCINGHWFYIDGQHINDVNSKKSLSRNAPCPCGSNKKFQNCHALNDSRSIVK